VTHEFGVDDGEGVSAKAGKSRVSMVFCSQRATEMLSLYTRTLPSVSVLCMKRA
jgi:hypothetical protein